MNILHEMKQHEHFNYLRRKILEFGVEQPFFDKEAKWGGYCLEQNSYDFTAFICWLKDTFPNGMRTYAEIGSAGGGFIRSIHELVGFKTGVSVDDGKWRADVWPENTRGLPILRYTGDSHAPETESWLKAQIEEIDLLFIDGDHSYEGVVKDIEMAKRILPKGCYVGFHDLYCTRVPGVRKAFDEMIMEKKTFEYLFQVVNHDHENPMGIAVCRTT